MNPNNHSLRAYFDHTPPAWGSDSHRWNSHPKGVLPLWVADMDFDPPQAISTGLAKRAARPFWYSHPSARQTACVCNYLQRRFAWQVEADWVVWLPGLMVGVYQAILQLPPNSSVLLPNPIYPPLLHAASLRRALPIPMLADYASQSWSWPLPPCPDDASALILCNPHNPSGKVFTADQLRHIGDYVMAHKLLLISDDIHADLCPDEDYQPLVRLCPALLNSSITLFSAGKTFNLAGLNCSFAIVPNQQLRHRLQARLKLCGETGQLGVLATQLAFTHGEPWRQALLAYLRANRELLNQALAACPGLEWIPNQGTYLGWINCAAQSKDFYQRLLNNGLALSPGAKFGDPLAVRINCAVPRDRLQQALEILLATAKAG